MFDQTIRKVMETRKFLTISPGDTVSHASKLMRAANIGALLVVENGHLIGIFTERDALFRVMAQELDPATTLLLSVMTAEPITLGPEKSYGHALLLMQENGFRHIPVIENGHPIGIVSSRNAMDPDLEELVWEVRRREHYR